MPVPHNNGVVSREFENGSYGLITHDLDVVRSEVMVVCVYDTISGYNLNVLNYTSMISIPPPSPRVAKPVNG